MPDSEDMNGISNTVKEEGVVDSGAQAIGSESQGSNLAMPAEGEIVSER